jgi:DNA-binding GntR family transcriptional regulator
VLAEELGVPIVRAAERLFPIVLSDPEAGLLEQPDGAPAILSKRVTLAHDDTVVLVDHAFIPGARFVVTAVRQMNDVSIQYEVRGGGGET